VASPGRMRSPSTASPAANHTSWSTAGTAEPTGSTTNTAGHGMVHEHTWLMASPGRMRSHSTASPAAAPASQSITQALPCCAAWLAHVLLLTTNHLSSFHGP
jgi:hypothetical protein